MSPKGRKRSYRVRATAQYGDKRDKQRLDDYKKRIKERKMEASREDWVIHGRPFNRYKMMDYIVTRVSNGDALTKVCDEEGMPSMLMVYGWFDNHPEFAKDMRRAEEIRGHRLGEEALEIAKSTDRVNVAADKLKYEALSKAAARTNNRFQDKQVVQTVDEYANMTEDQIRARISRMIEANPDLRSVLSEHPSVQETGRLSQSSEPQYLDCAQIETPDAAED